MHKLLIFIFISVSLISAGSDVQLDIPFQQVQSIYDTKQEYEREDGSTLRFSSFKKKVVLVHVWAHWCATTENRPEELAALKKEIDNKGFDIVHVSMDDDKKAWKEYIKENQWHGHHIMRPMLLRNPLSKIIYIPEEKDGQTTYWIDVDTYFIIGKNGEGRAIGKGLTKEEMATEIAKALQAK